jgi:hypothetical protein
MTNTAYSYEYDIESLWWWGLGHLKPVLELASPLSHVVMTNTAHNYTYFIESL